MPARSSDCLSILGSLPPAVLSLHSGVSEASGAGDHLAHGLGTQRSRAASWLTGIYVFSLFLQNFAKEFVISDRKELEEDFIKSELKKAGGANYDAQTE